MISLDRLSRNAAFTAALLLSPGLVGGAQAQPSGPEPGLLYRVVDLGRGDALPLFQQPDDGGELVGELCWNARDIVLSGASTEAAGRIWYQVVHDGEYAWADAAHVAPQDENRIDNFPLQCLGTEPFWSVGIDGDAVFEAPDVAQTTWTASEWLPARGLIGRYMIRLGSGYGTGYLAMLRQTCSDGMSDIDYPFEAIMITPGQAVRAGCCRRAGAR
jgi:uncharacterized membrane protein